VAAVLEDAAEAPPPPVGDAPSSPHPPADAEAMRTATEVAIRRVVAIG